MNIRWPFEFDSHRLIAHFHDPEIGLDAIICLHRGNTIIPAFGATRIARYKNYNAALQDSLRLSRLMSYKAAMAGLKYGGGKGVIILHSQPTGRAREKLLKKYASYVNYLAGHFVTGADLGMTHHDVSVMKKSSAFIVGVNSNPVKFTTLGLMHSLKVTLKEVIGSDDITKRSFAIQGLGKIGSSFLHELYGQAHKIYAADVDSERVKHIKKYYPKVEIVKPEDIVKQRVDVFSPCAASGVINLKTINRLNCQMIVGGANNQINNPETGELLHKLGILYAPDYIVNAGGLISVVDEYEHRGQFSEKRASQRVKHIPETLKKIFAVSRKTRKGTNIVADEMAQKIFNAH